MMIEIYFEFNFLFELFLFLWAHNNQISKILNYVTMGIFFFFSFYLCLLECNFCYGFVLNVLLSTILTRPFFFSSLIVLRMCKSKKKAKHKNKHLSFVFFLFLRWMECFPFHWYCLKCEVLLQKAKRNDCLSRCWLVFYIKIKPLDSGASIIFWCWWRIIQCNYKRRHRESEERTWKWSFAWCSFWRWCWSSVEHCGRGLFYLFISTILINMIVICSCRMVIWSWSSFWLRHPPTFFTLTILATLLFGLLHKYVFSMSNSLKHESHLRIVLNQNGHLEIVEFLFEKGARQIDREGHFCSTAFWTALDVRIVLFFLSWTFNNK